MPGMPRQITPASVPASLPALLLLLLLLVYCARVLAATPAGTVIRNQASATYIDDTGRSVTVTSNIVETTIQQVAGFSLAQDQQQRVTSGSQVVFSHRISNSGNGDDRFSLTLANAAGDDFNVGSLAIYADFDQDGVADNATPLSTTPWLAAGSDMYVVVSGQVPAGIADGDAAVVVVTAQSAFEPTLSQSNTDTVKVDAGAAVVMTKTMSSASGLSPGGPHTVTLRYENTGIETAFNVTLLDALPAGMQYVAGSARWSTLSTPLSDQDPLDAQGNGAASILYCAYDASCSGLAEAQTDADTTSVNQVTAIVSSVASGDSGTVSFDVTIDPLLTTRILLNRAELEFDAGGATVPRTYSNTVSFHVGPSAGVVINGSVATSIDGMNEPVSVTTAAQAGFVVFRDVVWNTGNTVDVFNIEVDLAGTTFPAGTVYNLVQADTATPLLDTNGDGLVDTGPVQPGDFEVVNLKLQLPPGLSGNNSGFGYDMTVWARSADDASVSNDIINHLDEIVANQVDLTNQAAAGSPGALGAGPGPELTPVSIATVGNRNIAQFDLFVRHQGSVPDRYLLSAHGDASGGALPDGWFVSFTDALTGQPLSSTASLASGDTTHIIASVQVPASLPPGTSSVYFTVQSDVTGATDVKHDAVQLAQNNALSLAPALSAQLEPGGNVVYEHVLTNTGNTAITDITVLAVHSAIGWSSELYLDTDLDGTLSPADQLIMSSLSLLPGESIDIFAKVFAPLAAQLADRNNTTLTAASASIGVSSQLIDVSTTSLSRVAIKKQQATDNGCDGVPDAGSDFTTEEISVAPGNNCVLYRLTAINNGTEPSYNVKIHDYTPSYTVYHPSAQCSRTPCWMNEPAAGQTGTINAETDQLLPGDSFFVQFAVRVQ